MLPVVFPDGTTADLVYPPSLDLAALGVFPYSSGSLQHEPPSRELGPAVSRDFFIRCGDLAEILALLNGGRSPTLLAEYEGADGQRVGLWDFHNDDTVHRLGFQFGRWAVLVYDYVAGASMTDAQRARWAASFSGRESSEGFLVLEASSPLRLARTGEHAGPELTFSAARSLSLYPGACRPHRHQTKLVGTKLVSWSGEFASWCLSSSMRAHATGNRQFIGPLIRGLEAKDVTLAPR